MFQGASLKKVELEAASAQIENYPRLDFVADRPTDGRTYETGFLFAADYFELDATLSLDSLHQPAVVAHFPRC